MPKAPMVMNEWTPGIKVCMSMEQVLYIREWSKRFDVVTSTRRTTHMQPVTFCLHSLFFSTQSTSVELSYACYQILHALGMPDGGAGALGHIANDMYSIVLHSAGAVPAS